MTRPQLRDVARVGRAFGRNALGDATAHPVDWLTASPLWDRALEDEPSRERFRRPAILRFDTDDFMGEVQKLLAARNREETETGADDEFADHVARPETWRETQAGWVDAGDVSLSRPLELFQPVHGRFYLAAASLICRRPGLPPRKVDAGQDERASLVLRRRVPKESVTFDPEDPATWDEHGWVKDGSSGRWEPVPTGGVLDGEERRPLFQICFRDAQGRRRHLHAGLIPVGSREDYEGHDPRPAPPASTPEPGGDPLADVSDPRKALWAEGPARALESLALPDSDRGAVSDVDVAREISTFAALDVADFLREHLSAVWNALEADSDASLSAVQRALYQRFQERIYSGIGVNVTWAEALQSAHTRRRELLEGELPIHSLDAFANRTLSQIRQAAQDWLSDLETPLFDALDEVEPPATGPLARLAEDAAAADGDPTASGAVYHVRCVYERPGCGRLDRPVVSTPSRPFRLAPFFDADAPARPFRLSLPADTSIRGLRKFPKNVSILLSTQLRSQMSRAVGVSLKDLDEGKPGSAQSFDLGMLCSLSIPIITICALIVLMIFVQLLNIVFWWLPFFRICLPIPKRSS